MLAVDLCVWSDEGWNNGTLTPAIAGIQIVLFTNVWRGNRIGSSKSGCCVPKTVWDRSWEEKSSEGWVAVIFFFFRKLAYNPLSSIEPQDYFEFIRLHAFACTNPICANLTFKIISITVSHSSFSLLKKLGFCMKFLVLWWMLWP